MENKGFKLIFILSIFLFLTVTVNAQFFTGGAATINYANGIYADVAPIFGYRIVKFEFGVSPVLSWAKPNSSQIAHYAYGARVFATYNIFTNFHLHAEGEAMNMEITENTRKWVYGLPVGAGYHQTVGKTTIYATVLYDVLLDKNSTKENPMVRGGVKYSF